MISIPYRIEIQSSAKSACSISSTSSAQPALPGNPGRVGWAELVGEIELAYLAVILDLDSVWYRDHLIPFWAKYEENFFGLTGILKIAKSSKFIISKILQLEKNHY